MESLLAGVHDAFALGDGPGGLTDEQAAQALRALMGISDAATEIDNMPSPLSLAAPDANGTSALSEQPKRGPGRPRKFQEPPA